MDKLIIEVELLSETIFGNGESSPGQVDSDILKDENGIPFFSGKNLKGKLKEEAKQIIDILDDKDRYGSVSDSLFGSEEQSTSKNTKLRFSDCTLEGNVINNIKFLIQDTKNGVAKNDITDALTEIRSFTSMKNGVPKDKSLRQARVIKKGLKFYCNVYLNEELTEDELSILCCTASALRNLGTMESRGKGNVKCRIYVIGDNDKREDITLKYVEKFKKEVL